MSNTIATTTTPRLKNAHNKNAFDVVKTETDLLGAVLRQVLVVVLVVVVVGGGGVRRLEY